MPDTTDAILLASGFSERFGKEDKLVSPFRGRPLLSYTVELACSAPWIDSVYLIYASDAVRTAASRWADNLHPVHNAHPERGLGESVRLGVAASTAEYYLFFHCDQPFLDAATLDILRARRGPGKIVVPGYNGKPGNPAVFSATFRQDLLALADGDTPRSIKQRNPDRVETVACANPLALCDIDTVAQARLLESGGEWPIPA